MVSGKYKCQVEPTCTYTHVLMGWCGECHSVGVIVHYKTILLAHLLTYIQQSCVLKKPYTYHECIDVLLGRNTDTDDIFKLEYAWGIYSLGTVMGTNHSLFFLLFRAVIIYWASSGISAQVAWLVVGAHLTVTQPLPGDGRTVCDKHCCQV